MTPKLDLDLGRSASLDELELGEIAVFRFQKDEDLRLAVCAMSVSRDGARPIVEIFLQSDDSVDRRLKGHRPSTLSRISAWVLPRSISIVPDVSSMTNELHHNLEACAGMLFIGKDGGLLLPVFDQMKPNPDPTGWLSLSDSQLVLEPERYKDNLACFSKWKICVWKDSQQTCVWHSELQ